MASAYKRPTEPISSTQRTQSISRRKKIYLDISSSSRDRNLYPNPNDFVIPVGTMITGTSENSINPVVNAVPVYSKVTGIGSTNTIINLIDPSYPADYVIIEGYYYNYYLEIDLGLGPEFRRILQYYQTGPSIETAVVAAPFSGAPAVSTVFAIRKEIPWNISTFGAGSTTTQLVLNAGAPDLDSTYWILPYLGGVLNTSNTRRILAYDSVTKIATVLALSSAPVIGERYDIMLFSYENFQKLISFGIFREPGLFSVELKNMVIADKIITSSYGGTITYYPFVYLEFEAFSKTTSNNLWTNNPDGGRRALFKIPVDDVRTSPSIETTGYFEFPIFTALENTSMTHTVFFHPSDSYRFRVLLPSGERIVFRSADTLPPLPPDPTFQTTVTFEMGYLSKYVDIPAEVPGSLCKKRYLDIYSGTRDRNRWPNPCDFECCYGEAVLTTEPQEGVNPISRELPVFIGIISPALLTRYVIIDSLYVKEGYLPFPINQFQGYYLYNVGLVQSRVIVSSILDPFYLMALIAESDFIPLPVADFWGFVRERPPFEYGYLGANMIDNHVTLGAGASAVDDFYKGGLWFCCPPTPTWVGSTTYTINNCYSRIIAYNGTTKVATLTDVPEAYSIPLVPGMPVAGTYYEILRYTDDSWKYLICDCASTAPRCYAIRLLQIYLPNGQYNFNTLPFPGLYTLFYYPFIYLHFIPKNKTYAEPLITDNFDGSRGALFKVPVDDDRSIFNYEAHYHATFVILNGRGMTQKIWLCPKESFHIRMTTPDGTVLFPSYYVHPPFHDYYTDFYFVDSQPPRLPYPFMQTSVTFELTPLC